jgi:hypothetical protein
MATMESEKAVPESILDKNTYPIDTPENRIHTLLTNPYKTRPDYLSIGLGHLKTQNRHFSFVLYPQI